MEFFLVFIFYHYNKMEDEHLRESIFLQMKNYSYDFKGDKFDIDIVQNKKYRFYELQEDSNYLYIYINLKDKADDAIKIFYPKSQFIKEFKHIEQRLFLNFIFLSIISFVIAIVFSLYSLSPLKKSYLILTEFIKDIIHDINTPISAIKLNLQLIDKKDDEILSITQSINTLEMLHKNLDNYLSDSTMSIASCDIKNILQEQIDFFSNIYDWLDWRVEIDSKIIDTDKYILSRIIYNLLNNACKYNKTNGFVKIVCKDRSLSISNSSYGIKNPKKVFNRFYKESDRGLGIGLHIVSKFLNQLGYGYKIDVDGDNVVCFRILY